MEFLEKSIAGVNCRDWTATLRHKIRFYVIVGLLLILITACQLFQPSGLGNPISSPKEIRSTPSDVSPPINVPQKNLKIFLVALEDAGKSGAAIGCGDSLVPVDIETTDARSALEFLLAHNDRFYGQSGLYNTLNQSDLKVVRYDEKSGSIEVDLVGKFLLGGICDNPRVKAQLEATIRQSAESTFPVILRINGELLDDVLSQK
jgi:hypothetical protein